MWILPTMGRGVQCAEMAQRLKAMGCSTPGVVFVNGDPVAYEGIDLHLPEGWRVIEQGAGENIGVLWSRRRHGRRRRGQRRGGRPRRRGWRGRRW